MVQYEGWASSNMRSSFYKEKYKPVEDSPTEMVSISCTRQISSKCETLGLWQLLGVLLQLVLHHVWRSTGPQAGGQRWLSCGRDVGAARVAPTHAHAQEIWVSQCSLYSKLICVIVHVCEEEVGGEIICDTKLHFSEFFTYKGRKNQYSLKKQWDELLIIRVHQRCQFLQRWSIYVAGTMPFTRTRSIIHVTEFLLKYSSSLPEASIRTSDGFLGMLTKLHNPIGYYKSIIIPSHPVIAES